MVLYCQTTSASTAPCTSRRMCCPAHCAIYCAPYQPLFRDFFGGFISTSYTSHAPYRCLAKMENTRQSMLDAGLGFWISGESAEHDSRCVICPPRTRHTLEPLAWYWSHWPGRLFNRICPPALCTSSNRDFYRGTSLIRKRPPP